jgi:hypothetical protein
MVTRMRDEEPSKLTSRARPIPWLYHCCHQGGTVIGIRTRMADIENLCTVGQGGNVVCIVAVFDNSSGSEVERF